jgi:hypothetical protein
VSARINREIKGSIGNGLYSEVGQSGKRLGDRAFLAKKIL